MELMGDLPAKQRCYVSSFTNPKIVLSAENQKENTEENVLHISEEGRGKKNCLGKGSRFIDNVFFQLFMLSIDCPLNVCIFLLIARHAFSLQNEEMSESPMDAFESLSPEAGER